MNRLRELRKLKEMSQWRLALESKVHQSRISLAENYLIELTEEEQKGLAGVLGTTVIEIFDDEEPTVAPQKNNQREKSLSGQK